MKPAKRIHLKRGKQKRKFILCGGVIPEAGDVCTLKGEDWEVVKVEETEIVAQFRHDHGGTLKQVFP